MINFLQKSLLFVCVLFVQIFFVDQIDLGGWNNYFSPLIYGIIIIFLQPSIELWIVMFIALLMGLGVDLFRNTIGLHISSLVFVAFFKYSFLNFIFPRDDYDQLKDLNIFNLGWSNYLLYTGVMLFVHHLWFYSIEDFHFNKFPFLILKAVLNSLIALAVFIFIYFINPKRK